MSCFPPNKLTLNFTCSPHPLASSSSSFFFTLSSAFTPLIASMLPFSSSLFWSHPFFFLLYVCLNAFTPPLHSHKCFIHQSQHSSTTPGILACSAQSPTPSPSTLLRPNTWCIPRGPRTLSFFLPLALIVHATMLLLLYIQWRQMHLEGLSGCWVTCNVSDNCSFGETWDFSVPLNVLPVYFTQPICHVSRPIQYYGVQNVLLFNASNLKQLNKWMNSLKLNKSLSHVLRN